MNKQKTSYRSHKAIKERLIKNLRPIIKPIIKEVLNEMAQTTYSRDDIKNAVLTFNLSEEDLTKIYTILDSEVNEQITWEHLNTKLFKAGFDPSFCSGLYRILSGGLNENS